MRLKTMSKFEYEEGMEKREDLMIHGNCERHGRVQAMPKRYIGQLEPHWLCPTCGQPLTDIVITPIAFPCNVCGFFEAEDIGGGNWVCGRCFKIWERVSTIVALIARDSSDAEAKR